MLAVLLEQDHREQARAGPAARRRVERCRRLADCLAAPAGELLAHVLHDLPLARDHLERLGDVLAELRERGRTAARAPRRCQDHDPLARQMLGERLARRLSAGETLDLLGTCRAHGDLGPEIVLGCARLQFFELERELLDKAALRSWLPPPTPGLRLDRPGLGSSEIGGRERAVLGAAQRRHAGEGPDDGGAFRPAHDQAL